MTKKLLKVLNKAFFPAATLVVTKVLGLFLATEIWNFNWYVKNFTAPKNFFTVRFMFESENAALTANTFSNIFMYSGILLICLLVLLQAKFLHSEKQHPVIVSKLAKVNMLGSIKNTQEILLNAFIWYSALWIATIVCIYSGLSETASVWIAPATFIASLVISTALIKELDTGSN